VTSIRTAAPMILILALASCTSAAVDQVASNPAPVVAVSPISSFPRITDPSPDSLPIEAFLLSSRQEQELLTGQQRLITQCMAKSGYAYNVPESANAAAAGRSWRAGMASSAITRRVRPDHRPRPCSRSSTRRSNSPSLGGRRHCKSHRLPAPRSNASRILVRKLYQEAAWARVCERS
jgi:hypothetical protein